MTAEAPLLRRVVMRLSLLFAVMLVFALVGCNKKTAKKKPKKSKK